MWLRARHDPPERTFRAEAAAPWQAAVTATYSLVSGRLRPGAARPAESEASPTLQGRPEGGLSKKRVRSVARPFCIHNCDTLVNLLVGHVQPEFAT
jgi:hypothetical protein